MQLETIVFIHNTRRKKNWDNGCCYLSCSHVLVAPSCWVWGVRHPCRYREAHTVIVVEGGAKATTHWDLVE